MNYTTANIKLGPKEIEIISRLTYAGLRIVTKNNIEELFPENFVTRKVLYQLRKKNIIANIGKGIYLFSPIESLPAGRGINPNLIPNYLFPKKNYYIGYSTQYNGYGFTEQIFQVLYVINTTYQCKRVIDGMRFEFVKASPDRMYGIEKRDIQGAEVLFSDKERTLVDLFVNPDPIGGLAAAFDVLKEEVKYKTIDLNKFITYAVKFPVKSVRKRIGYGLELAKVPVGSLGSLVNSIKDTSPVSLYPGSRKGAMNNRWRLIINAS